METTIGDASRTLRAPAPAPDRRQARAGQAPRGGDQGLLHPPVRCSRWCWPACWSSMWPPAASGGCTGCCWAGASAWWRTHSPCSAARRSAVADWEERKLRQLMQRALRAHGLTAGCSRRARRSCRRHRPQSCQGPVPPRFFGNNRVGSTDRCDRGSRGLGMRAFIRWAGARHRRCADRRRRARSARADELLVMPYTCTMVGGRPLLTPAPEQSHRIIGRREQRTVHGLLSRQSGNVPQLDRAPLRHRLRGRAACPGSTSSPPRRPSTARARLVGRRPPAAAHAAQLELRAGRSVRAAARIRRSLPVRPHAPLLQRPQRAWRRRSWRCRSASRRCSGSTASSCSPPRAPSRATPRRRPCRHMPPAAAAGRSRAAAAPRWPAPSRRRGRRPRRRATERGEPQPKEAPAKAEAPPPRRPCRSRPSRSQARAGRPAGGPGSQAAAGRPAAGAPGGPVIPKIINRPEGGGSRPSRRPLPRRSPAGLRAAAEGRAQRRAARPSTPRLRRRPTRRQPPAGTAPRHGQPAQLSSAARRPGPSPRSAASPSCCWRPSPSRAGASACARQARGRTTSLRSPSTARPSANPAAARVGTAPGPGPSPRVPKPPAQRPAQAPQAPARACRTDAGRPHSADTGRGRPDARHGRHAATPTKRR